MTALTPRDPADLADIIGSAVTREHPLELVGRGTKRAFGRPMGDLPLLDLSALSGLRFYEPDELVLRAGAATGIAEIESMLAQSRQQFAFEPPDFGPLFGGPAEMGTLGGMIACNLAGPRRISAGAARDHFLGFQAVNGRGEIFKSGSRVMKNVTGYDLPKLLAGSFGTLAALTEVTCKVMPRPEKTRTVLVYGLDDEKGRAALSAGLGSSHEVSGAAHLPAAVASLISIDLVKESGRAVTALRLEGPEPSVAARCLALRAELADYGPTEELHSMRSISLWKTLRDAQPFVAAPAMTVWRVSVAPTQGPAVAAAAKADLHWFDWGGGQVWLGFHSAASEHAAPLRAAVAKAGGHALMIRAALADRAAQPVFSEQNPVLATLSARVKAGFDPKRILNPGRMHEGL